MAISSISEISVPSNRFHAGMTRQEARSLGREKSFWRRDFNNIDTNRDGVLSINEIMAERNRVSKSYKQDLLLWGTIFGALDLVMGDRAWVLADIALIGAGALYGNQIDKKSEMMNKFVRDNNIDPNSIDINV